MYLCKAEEGGDVVASLAYDNAADGKTGGAESLIIGRMNHWPSSVSNRSPLAISQIPRIPQSTILSTAASV